MPGSQSALGSGLLRHRLPLLAVLAGAFGAVTSTITSPNAPDAELFADAARQLTSSSGLDVFTDARLQVGPVYLIMIAPLVRIAALLGVDAVPVVSGIMSAALAIVLALLVRRLRGGPAPVAELGVGLSVVFGTPLHVVARDGHFEELATVLLLVVAGLAVQAGHGRRAAVLVGLAAGCKLWGLLGVPVLLLDSAPLLAAFPVQRRRVGRGLVAVAVVAGTYAPFALLSHVATFEHSWMVGYPSPFALIARGADFTFQLRLVQGGLAVAVGAWLATDARTRPAERVWTVPAAICLTRLLMDPYIQNYYLAPVMVCLALGLWCRAASGPGELRVAMLSTAVAPVVLGTVLVASGPPGALVCALLFLAILGVLARPEAVTRSLAQRFGQADPQPESGDPLRRGARHVEHQVRQVGGSHLTGADRFVPPSSGVGSGTGQRTTPRSPAAPRGAARPTRSAAR